MVDIRGWFLPSQTNDDSGTFTKREKVMVLGVAYVLAVGLWFMVNMDREFTITTNLPVVLGELSEGKALRQPIPTSVQVTLNGPGWDLMSAYGNLPNLVLDVRQEEVDVLASARDLLTGGGVNVLRVQPFMLTIRIDERITKRVPIEPRLQIDFRNRYDLVGPIRLFPDSVDISGAKSVLDTIRSWPTRRDDISGVRDAMDLTLALVEPSYIMQVSHPSVRIEADVAEYTEGEVRIPIRTRGQPRNRDVVYSPTFVTVKYDVPIDEYTRSLGQVLFAAYVSYTMATRDSTGFVVPQIERTESSLNIRIRSFQPRTVSYYHIVAE